MEWSVSWCWPAESIQYSTKQHIPHAVKIIVTWDNTVISSSHLYETMQLFMTDSLSCGAGIQSFISGTFPYPSPEEAHQHGRSCSCVSSISVMGKKRWRIKIFQLLHPFWKQNHKSFPPKAVKMCPIDPKQVAPFMLLQQERSPPPVHSLNITDGKEKTERSVPYMSFVQHNSTLLIEQSPFRKHSIHWAQALYLFGYETMLWYLTHKWLGFIFFKKQQQRTSKRNYV